MKSKSRMETEKITRTFNDRLINYKWWPSIFFILFLVGLFSVPCVFAAGRQQLNGCEPREVETSKIIGNVPVTTQILLSISLPIRNEKERNLLSQQIHDQKSPRYGTVLTEKEYDEKFAPTKSDYQSLINFLESKGLTVLDRLPLLRTSISARGTIGDIEKAFHVHFYFYQRPDGTKFRAPDREPSIDLNVQISEIHGFDDLGRIVGAPILKKIYKQKSSAKGKWLEL